MSFSISVNAQSDEARSIVAHDSTLPQPVKDFIRDGILALAKQYGDNVKVAVSAQGHLHNGQAGDSDTTSLSLQVYKAPAEPA